VFESYSAGTLAGMGWGWEVVHAINPRTVMISAPGWGARGLYQGYVTLGSGLDASSGHTSVRGYPGDPPENTRPIFHSDATGALTIVFAALAALRRREASGEGCFVDISQIEALTWQLPGLLGDWTMNARIAPPLGNADPHVVPHEVYRALGDDSWVFVAAEDDEQWAGLARLIGRPEWAERAHAFASIVGRLRGRGEIDEAIARFTRVRSSFEAAEAVQAAGAIGAPAISSPEFMASDQIMNRGWLQPVTHRYAGTNLMPGFLWSLAPDPPTWDRPSGLVGEHNVEVLTELGFTTAEIEALDREGVIGHRYALPA
jgi:crotonobetainyl-CoA:carnitine CoA-transferase CaiB-like acyl-CoA transferase